MGPFFAEGSPEGLIEGPHVRPAVESLLDRVRLRHGVINRAHRQHTGYWQADGEGVEHIFPDEWALTLDLLGDGDPVRHAKLVRALVERDHLPVALRLAPLNMKQPRRTGGAAFGLRRAGVRRRRRSGARPGRRGR